MAAAPSRKIKQAPRPYSRPLATTPVLSHDSSTLFADIPGLHPALLKAIPFERCTDVQAATLPVILNGQDVFAQAKTGTGKTLAFLVPSIQQLLIVSPPAPATRQVSILVLSPTRELAQQIAKEAEMLSAGRLGVQCVVGGTNMNMDLSRIRNQRADILIATPGRMVDLLENGGIGPKLQQLRTLVLDEADRLLDQGFRAALNKIIGALPTPAQSPRQTLLFSATVAPEIRNIAALALRPDHKFISTLKEEDINTHEHVEQEVLTVPANDLIAATYEVIKREQSLAASRGGLKIMVFLPTVGATALYHDIMSQVPLPCPVFEIHSKMSQAARTRATDAFRAAETGILFSSDVTARGIDVKGVTAVIQVGLPSNAEQSRAGAKGHGILVLGTFETGFLRDRTIAGLPIKPYPTLDSSSLSNSKSAVSSALQKIDDATKSQAYRAWLGYYKSNVKTLKWDVNTLVQHANEYARRALLFQADVSDGEWKPPGLLAQTIGKMGLRGVPGLNKVAADPEKEGQSRGPPRSAPTSRQQPHGGIGGAPPRQQQQHQGQPQSRQQQQGQQRGGSGGRGGHASRGGASRGGGFGLGGASRRGTGAGGSF